MVLPTSLKSNYIYNLSYQLLALILPLITTPYISRVLNADNVGTYSYTTSIVTYFSMFAVLGTETYGQLQIACEQGNKTSTSILFWEIFSLRAVCTSVCTIAYLIFAFTSINNHTMFLILTIIMASQITDISWLLQGLEQFKRIVFRNYLVRIIGVILIFTFVKQRGDLYKYALILQGTALLGNITLWGFLSEYLVPISVKILHPLRHLKQCLVYFLPTVATSVYMVLDKSMIGWFSNSSYQNGYYEQAQKIEQIAVTVVTSLSTVTMPRMAFLFREKRSGEVNSIMNNTIGFVLFLSIPMTFGLMGISSTLIPWFLGQEYGPCINLLRIFSILIIVVGLNNTIGKQCLIATGRQKYYNLGVIMGAVVNLGINLVLIPKISSLGAAIATVCAEAVILSVFIYYSRDIFKSIDIKFDLLKYFIASGIMSISVHVVGIFCGTTTFGIISQILIAIIIYSMLLLLLGDKFTIALISNFKAKHK